MADYVLTQTGDEVQDILDNSQTGKYFYNQSVATWSSDATYADYPKKGLINLTGVKGTDGVEVTFSNADATSGNYSPICNTVANGVEIWAKAQDNGLVIPTIHITTGADVQLSGDDAYLPISGGNITGSLSVANNSVLTMAGGNITGNLSVANNSVLTVAGGNITGSLSVGGSPVITRSNINTYSGTGTTNSYGNLSVPGEVVKPSTGAILGIVTDSNYKAVVLGTDSDAWVMRFYNYATTNMNSVTSTSVSYTIHYILY